jgi:hypothetical protein
VVNDIGADIAASAGMTGANLDRHARGASDESDSGEGEADA